MECSFESSSVPVPDAVNKSTHRAADVKSGFAAIFNRGNPPRVENSR